MERGDLQGPLPAKTILQFSDFMRSGQLHFRQPQVSRPESVAAKGYSNTQTPQGQKKKGHTPFGPRVGHLSLKTGLKSPPQYKPLDRHWRLSFTMIWTMSFSWDSPCQDLSCSCPGHSMGWTRPAHVPETFSEHSSAHCRPSQAAHTTVPQPASIPNSIRKAQASDVEWGIQAHLGTDAWATGDSVTAGRAVQAL